MARVGLNTIKVVGAAADLVDETGFRALSLATLAGRLGVRVPSLYKHIDGIDDLRGRLAILGRDELAAALNSALAESSGMDALRATATAYAGYAAEHPGRFAGIGWTTPDGEAGRALTPIFEQVAAECGVPAAQTAVAAFAIRSVLRGFADLRVAGSFGGDDAVIERVFALLLDMVERSLPQTTGARVKGLVPPPPSIRRKAATP
jgi:AcrR family transcriptional regulator